MPHANDQELRERALELANYDASRDSHEIVNRARAFYAFLKGDTETASDPSEG